MPIKSGSEWGESYRDGCPVNVASTDSEIGRIVEESWDNAMEVPVIGVIGGDIWRAAGSPIGGEARLDSSSARAASIDVAEVLIEDRRYAAVAHVFFLRNWWRGAITAIMNSEWRGSWRVAPRAHPNDGWLDLLAGDLSLHQRWLARQRIKSGEHLPNSNLDSRRIKEFTHSFPRRTRAIIDGVSVGDCQTVAVRVIPDAISIVY